jgi:hypothetical protein
MPYKVNDYTVSLEVDHVKMIFPSGEINPTTAQGIERENMVISLQSFHTLPVYTFDGNGADIGPRKRPNP